MFIGFPDHSERSSAISTELATRSWNAHKEAGHKLLEEEIGRLNEESNLGFLMNGIWTEGIKSAGDDKEVLFTSEATGQGVTIKRGSDENGQYLRFVTGEKEDRNDLQFYGPDRVRVWEGNMYKHSSETFKDNRDLPVVRLVKELADTMGIDKEE